MCGTVLPNLLSQIAALLLCQLQCKRVLDLLQPRTRHATKFEVGIRHLCGIRFFSSLPTSVTANP